MRRSRMLEKLRREEYVVMAQSWIIRHSDYGTMDRMEYTDGLSVSRSNVGAQFIAPELMSRDTSTS